MPAKGSYQDVTGEQWNMLKAVRCLRIEPGKGSIWEFECQCEDRTLVELPVARVRFGCYKGCPACRYERVSVARSTHGMSGTAEYRCYHNMIDRCTNPKNKRWSRYGGRVAEQGGPVTVCDRWMECFENFIYDMGCQPDDGIWYSIERKEVRDGYYPSNCCWIPMADQALNTTASVKVNVDGEEKVITRWAREEAVSRTILTDVLTKISDPRLALEETRRRMKFFQETGRGHRSS